MDRQEASRNLAKAIAYVECGKPEQAAEWLEDLLVQFENAGVSVRMATRRMGLDVPMEPVDNDPVGLSASARHAERIERQDAEDIRERQRDMRAASAWLGGRLLGREGSQVL